MSLPPATKRVSLLQAWRYDLALRNGWGWLRDPHFGLALLAAVLFWWLWPEWAGAVLPAHKLIALAMLVLLQPVLEELLFRGLLQGQLLKLEWGRSQLMGLTLANMVSSVLFTALHFSQHPAQWAFAVILPSLLFGYFRDRHDSVYPAIALHGFYNAGYFLLPLVNISVVE